MNRTSFALLSATKLGALGSIDDPLALHPTHSFDADARSTLSVSSKSGSGRSKRFSFLHSRTNSDTSQTSVSASSTRSDGGIGVGGSAIEIEPSTPPFSPIDDGYLRTAWDVTAVVSGDDRSRRYSANMAQSHSYTAQHSYLKVDWNNPTPSSPPRAVSAEEFNHALRQRSPSGGALSLSPSHPNTLGSPCQGEHHHGRSQMNTTLTRPDACLRRASHNDAVSSGPRVMGKGYDALVPVDMGALSLQQALSRDNSRSYRY